MLEWHTRGDLKVFNIMSWATIFCYYCTHYLSNVLQIYLFLLFSLVVCLLRPFRNGLSSILFTFSFQYFRLSLINLVICSIWLLFLIYVMCTRILLNNIFHWLFIKMLILSLLDIGVHYVKKLSLLWSSHLDCKSTSFVNFVFLKCSPQFKYGRSRLRF